MKKLFRYILLVIIILVLVVGGYLYYQHKKIYPSTNDSYVQAHVVYIATRVSGKVSDIYIKNHQRVQKGQLLFRLDQTSFLIALSKAQANLENTQQQVRALQSEVVAANALVVERQAELNNIWQQTRRILTMVKKQLYAISLGDQAVSQLKVAKAALKSAQSQEIEAQQKLGAPGQANAQIKAARANLAEARLNIEYTRIYSPGQGYIENFNLRHGSSVSAYLNVFALIENKKWWATANFKETDLKRIHVGQPASISIDMYPNHVFVGKVSSISSGSGASFALLPPENASGNWVKVTQRFPVRVSITHLDPKYPLRMGASCTVTVDTSSSNG